MKQLRLNYFTKQEIFLWIFSTSMILLSFNHFFLFVAFRDFLRPFKYFTKKNTYLLSSREFQDHEFFIAGRQLK